MADDTTSGSPGALGDRIATDELATLNGVATVADGNGKLPKVQRVKVQHGSDGTAQDVDAAHPLPVDDADTQTALAAILAKLTADPATQTTLAAALAALGHLTDGTQQTIATPLASETPANVAASASVVTLQASNGSRRAWKCFNDSTSALYIKHGAAASTSSFTVKVPAGGYYEMPLPIYTGQITGIWDTANGNARMTEGA